MSVRRKYSLPGCTLILEGVAADTDERRPTISAVVNAECHIHGQGHILSGGQGFLRQLVETLSAYSQSLLSSIEPLVPEGHIRIEPIAPLQHRLTISDPGLDAPVSLELTTLQLFDLIESLDQMLSDTRTLPDWSLDLQPLTRHQARLDPPIAERATPVAVGASGLAIAALAMFFMPVPEVRRPEEPVPVSTEATTEDSTGIEPPDDDDPDAIEPPLGPDGSGAASFEGADDSDEAADLDGETGETDEADSTDSAEAAADGLGELGELGETITDSDRLYALSIKLDRELTQNWGEDAEPSSDREYRVNVGQDGAIVGFISSNAAAETYLDSTPLPDLLYVPANAERADAEARAEFRVVFSESGTIEVSPWDGYEREPNAAPSLTEADIVEARLDALSDDLYEIFPEDPGIDRELEYRLGVTPDGVLAQWEPLTGDARTFYDETPLPELYEPSAAIATDEAGVTLAPLVEFRVVFTPSGTIEIAPWFGLPE
ncbi:MAG: DUF4335 domain-containing protein [Geitlerinemataceae cyanobacterium]